MGTKTVELIITFHRNPHKPVLYDLEKYTKLGLDDASSILMLKDAELVQRLLGELAQ